MKIKALLNGLKRWYKKYFVGKTIIYTHRFAPAELHNRYMHKGVKMVSLAFTNRRVVAGKIPFTIVPFTEVYMMRRMPSRFVKSMYALLGKRAKGKTYKITHKK